MSSTIETLERELAAAQAERESGERAVIRAQNAYEATCLKRDDAWSEASAVDPEVAELTALVYERRKTLYEIVDRLKASEGRERRIKSRLMYVLPAERRRYLSGFVDEEFHALLAEIQRVYGEGSPDLDVSVVTAKPGELDLAGDATWRALERLYGTSPRSWVEVTDSGCDPIRPLRVAEHISHYAGGHTPRVYLGGEEIRPGSPPDTGGPGVQTDAEGLLALHAYETRQGRLSLARITAYRYLDVSSVSRLCKRGDVLVKISDLARLYQTMNLTLDEIRWRLEQLISLRLDILRAIYELTGERGEFSFYEIARSARLFDAHYPDSGVASEALKRAVRRAIESSVPLVDVAYMEISGDISGLPD